MSKRKREQEAFDTRARRNAPASARGFSRNDYTIGWICAIPVEMAAARAMLDSVHDDLGNTPDDYNAYLFGAVGDHNVVIACLPAGDYGTTNAALVASQMRSSFPSIQSYLMVGVGGGVPGVTADIRLGDVVISTPTGKYPGVIRYKFGKTVASGRFEPSGVLNKPPFQLLAAVSKLRAKRMVEGCKISSFLSEALEKCPDTAAQFAYPGRHRDILYESEYDHVGGDTCNQCDPSKLTVRLARPTDDPVSHYGLIASGDEVMKHGGTRDRISQEYGICCFEMEAAGLMDRFPCLVIRGICDYSDSHKNKHWQGYAAAVAAAYAKELLYTLSPCRQANAVQQETDYEEIKTDCLQSLCYPDIDTRFHNIAEPHQNTCDWLFETEQFKRWKNRENIQDYNGVLWIKGKPGAGKSTLMKHALLHCEEELIDHTIASYFFNARSASQLEKTSLGMLRSLLYQVLDRDQAAFSRFIPRFLDKQRKHGKSWEWSPGELQSSLLELARCQSKRITLFVDALDECDEQEVRNVVAFLEKMGSVAISSGAVLNICLSSRHYPTIGMRKMLELVVDGQPGHTEDIAIYISESLRLSDKDIEEEIYEKAEGIFMWVVLVTAMLNNAFDDGRIQAVREKLREIPRDLNEVFSILLQKDNEHINETVCMLQWVLFSIEHLTPRGLYHAVQAAGRSEGLEKWDPSTATDQIIRRYITTVSRGLVEISQGSGQIAQFIHQTVIDFLVRGRRLQTLDPSLAPDVVAGSHDRLAQYCLRYIQMAEINPGGSSGFAISERVDEGPDPDRRCENSRIEEYRSYSLIKYSCLFIFNHAELAQGGGAGQQALLQQVQNNSGLLKRISNRHYMQAEYPQYRMDLPHAPESLALGEGLIHLLCWQNCWRLVQVLLELGVGVNSGNHVTPLEVAMVIGDPLCSADPGKAFSILLDAGADVNARWKSGKTPLMYAADLVGRSADVFSVERGVKLIKDLLRADVGASINVVDDHGRTALHMLVVSSGYRNLKTSAIRMLLDAGADVNVPDESGGTVLQKAVSPYFRSSSGKTIYRGAYGDPNIVRMLLEAGADVNARGGRFGTALHAATSGIFLCGRSAPEVIQMLLDAGADPNARALSPPDRSLRPLPPSLRELTLTEGLMARIRTYWRAHNAHTSSYAYNSCIEVLRGLKALQAAGAVDAAAGVEKMYTLLGWCTNKVAAFEKYGHDSPEFQALEPCPPTLENEYPGSWYYDATNIRNIPGALEALHLPEPWRDSEDY
ncbi:hypothetical protein DRE_05223 [Drechslerella stenobrocha 248]|uniref:Uncharacterized protein n=1 Tax=Drechslerella stenobrocha 248 TaxID=1043628 RepID=W7HZL9_9PEZI|nr:hypothetical protein DRE_05223 [Drechslerella stenobrocha 248]